MLTLIIFIHYFETKTHLTEKNMAKTVSYVSLVNCHYFGDV